MDDLYAILNVSPTASLAEIRQRYRILASACRPEKLTNASEAHRRAAAEVFKKINEAYRVLSIPDLRAEYDRRRAGLDAGGAVVTRRSWAKSIVKWMFLALSAAAMGAAAAAAIWWWNKPAPPVPSPVPSPPSDLPAESQRQEDSPSPRRSPPVIAALTPAPVPSPSPSPLPQRTPSRSPASASTPVHPISLGTPLPSPATPSHSSPLPALATVLATTTPLSASPRPSTPVPSTPQPPARESKVAWLKQIETAAVLPSLQPLQPTPFPRPTPAITLAPPPPPATPVHLARLDAVKVESMPSPPPPEPGPFPAASKDRPFVNSLGMKFVPISATGVLFAVWETRVQDYAAFATETAREWPKPDFPQSSTDPAVNVTWDDAVAFCQWLSAKEARTYRLPTDAEWSAAVGLTAEKGATPAEKDNNGPRDLYPWGRHWPPPPGTGNFADESAEKVGAGFGYIQGYNDGYPWTSPVEAFAPNALGIYDLAGNVENWCQDRYKDKSNARVLRGGSWRYYLKFYLRSASRSSAPADYRAVNYGFRCVIAKPGH